MSYRQPGTPYNQYTLIRQSVLQPYNAHVHGLEAWLWPTELQYLTVDWPYLYLFNVDKESFKLRGLSVGIPHKRRERISQEALFGNPLEAPVNRNTHLMHLLSIDIQCADTLGDDTGCDDLPSLAVDTDLVPVTNPFFGCQGLTDLDKRSRLSNRITQSVLCPEVMMLCQSISGRGIGVLVLGAKGLPNVIVYPGGRVTDGQLVVRVHWVHAQRRLERLVVLREWPIDHSD